MVGSHSEMAPSGNIRKALFMTYFFWFFNKSTPNIAVEERKIWERISRMRSWRCLRDAHWFHTILIVFLWAITSNTLEDSLRKATPKPRDSREPMSFISSRLIQGILWKSKLYWGGTIVWRAPGSCQKCLFQDWWTAGTQGQCLWRWSGLPWGWGSEAPWEALFPDNSCHGLSSVWFLLYSLGILLSAT